MKIYFKSYKCILEEIRKRQRQLPTFKFVQRKDKIRFLLQHKDDIHRLEG
jgi:hypothetical protein